MAGAKSAYSTKTRVDTHTNAQRLFHALVVPASLQLFHFSAHINGHRCAAHTVCFNALALCVAKQNHHAVAHDFIDSAMMFGGNFGNFGKVGIE
ncbi:MAG: hypothetical protein ACI9Y1_000826 [Lentisphaeria bacterium]